MCTFFCLQQKMPWLPLLKQKNLYTTTSKIFSCIIIVLLRRTTTHNTYLYLYIYQQLSEWLLKTYMYTRATGWSSLAVIEEKRAKKEETVSVIFNWHRLLIFYSQLKTTLFATFWTFFYSWCTTSASITTRMTTLSDEEFQRLNVSILLQKITFLFIKIISFLC